MRVPLLLALYWFAALAALGVFFPLFSLYLAENVGLSGFEIGLVTATLPLTGMIAQPLWGALADHSGSRVRILGALSVGAAAGYANLEGRGGLAPVLAATFGLALCSTSIMPMAVSVSLALLRERGRHAFGAVRSVGTLGYLVAVAGFPLLLRALPPQAGPGATASVGATEPGLGLMLRVASFAMALAAVAAFALPRTGAVALRAEAGDLRLLLANAPYRRLLLVTALLYLFLQGPLVMFPMYVRSLGGGLEDVSRMWMWMLAFEIPLLAGVAAAPSRVGARELVAVSVAADASRWLVTALASSLVVVQAAQVLHGLAVAGFVVGSAMYVEAVVPARMRSSAQGLVYMVGVSLGGLLSSLLSGMLLDAFGPRSPALFGGAGAAVLALALPRLLPRVPSSRHAEARD